MDAYFLGHMQKYRNNQSCLGSNTYAEQFYTWHLSAFNRDLGTIDVANLIKKEKEPQIVECTECRKNHAEESYELSIAPSVLVIHLKRSNFRLREVGQERVYGQCKGYRQVTYATLLTLRTISEEVVQFDLVGVIFHLGTNYDCGHYVAIVRDRNGWIRCDDGDISPSCEEDALNSGSLEMSPCMLFVVSVADHVAARVISRERRGRIVSKFYIVESMPKFVSKSIDRIHLVHSLVLQLVYF